MRGRFLLLVPVLAGAALLLPDVDAVAAAPVVDIAVERTLSTPTDIFPVSPTSPEDLDISLVNGGSAAQDASFSITVPQGWRVVPAYELPDDETCGVEGDAYRCTVDSLPAGQARSTQLLVTASAATEVGSLTAVPVTGGPIGAIDSDPSNNSTQFRLRNVGTSVVTASVATSATTVTVGQTVTFTVTVVNAGPDSTSGYGSFFRVLTDTPDGFVQSPPTGPGTVVEGGDADPPIAGPSYTVDGYDLLSGTTAVYTVTWRAQVRGAVGHLGYRASHDPYAPDGSTLVTADSAPVTVVGAGSTTTTTTATATTTTATATAPLADTGARHVVAGLGWGLGALVAGVVALVAGTRRRGRHAA